jgi:outer membrane protein
MLMPRVRNAFVLTAILGAALAVCAGCPAPYPPVSHHELARRILDPSYQSHDEFSQNPLPMGEGRVRAPEAIEQHPHPNPLPEGEGVRIESEFKLDDHRRTQQVSHDSTLQTDDGCNDLIEISADELTLASAIDMAYRANPTLQAARANIDLAKAGKEVAFAGFMPEVQLGFRDIVGKTGPPGFVLPTMPTDIGNVAFGGAAEQFRVAELRAQWTLWDFGRTTSRFGQSVIMEEIAGLQFVRSQQTVGFEVASAYFEALQAKASADIAEESVRRAKSVLKDAKNYLHRGTNIRNDVLRAEVFVKEMDLSVVRARTAEGVAIAKLNRAIGINPSQETQVVELADAPPFEQPLPECLQMAVENRREFGVVERGIAKAKLGENLAESQFMPRVYVGGLGSLQQMEQPDRFAQHASAGVGIELGLNQGGKRIGELRESKAEVNLAIARGKEVCDQIAYEVKVAYLVIDDARERIKVSRAAVAQASENIRVVRSLFDQGDAIATDVIEAELTMTRAQQGYLIALYDYQTSLARLAYALGLPAESFLALPRR